LLNKRENIRYSRHISLDNVGIEGQEKLKNAKILVIGAGGLGCPVLQYLTAVGIGNIGIIDFDIVEESNLQRQILFSTIDKGNNKATVAATKLMMQNPFVHFDIYENKLTNKNAIELFENYDLIIDGTDNFSTRYLVNDASIITGKPLVYGAIHKYEGQVSVFNYNNGPSYRCIFPDPPKAGSIPNCSKLGVIGVLPGIIGSFMANEAIKIVLKIGEVLSGKLMIHNILNNHSINMNIKKNMNEIQKVIDRDLEFKEFDYDLFCNQKDSHSINEITIVELKKIFDKNDSNYQLLDVREKWEEPKMNKQSVINIPLNRIDDEYDIIDINKETIVFCQRGIQSLQCIEILERKGYKNLINLKEGMIKW